MLAETARSLSMDRTNALLAGIARFLHVLLDMRFSTDALPSPAGGGAASPRFSELILKDGQATFSGVRSTAYQRRLAELARAALERRMCWMLTHCENVDNMLLQLERLCVGPLRNSIVDLYQAVAMHESQALGYACKLAIGADEDIVVVPDDVQPGRRIVSVGGIARPLAAALEPIVERWLLACDDAIEHWLVARDRAVNGTADAAEHDDPQHTYADLMRRSTLRKTLARLLADHIAMRGFYACEGDADGFPSPVRTPYVLGTPKMEELLRELFDAMAIERCETRRDDDMRRLELLGTLVGGDVDEAADALIENQRDLLRVLHVPPLVLMRRPGFAAGEFRLGALASIVRFAMEDEREVVARKLAEWRGHTGRHALGRLAAFLRESAAMLSAWTIPARGCVPTLRFLSNIPAPAWTDACETRRALASVRADIAGAMAATVDPASCVPRSIERCVRLLCLVWELLVYEKTCEAFFSHRVRSSILLDVVRLAQIDASFAMPQLFDYCERCMIGANFRNSAIRIARFRGSEGLENRIRDAARGLSSFSLQELMCVTDEQLSPVFGQLQWRLVDAIHTSMGAGRFRQLGGQSTAVVGTLLDSAAPLLLDLRSEYGMAFRAPPNALADLLRCFRPVREWEAAEGEELVLAKADLAGYSAQLVRALHGLHGKGVGVHLGRISRKHPRAATLGAARVLTLNGSDVRRALRGDVVEVADAPCGSAAASVITASQRINDGASTEG